MMYLGSRFRRRMIISFFHSLIVHQQEAMVSAENAQRSRKMEANKVLQKRGVLYLANARHMNRERLELEKTREEKRERAWHIWYDNACKKVFRKYI